MQNHINIIQAWWDWEWATIAHQVGYSSARIQPVLLVLKFGLGTRYAQTNAHVGLLICKFVLLLQDLLHRKALCPEDVAGHSVRSERKTEVPAQLFIRSSDHLVGLAGM